jgi:hypothetical protein
MLVINSDKALFKRYNIIVVCKSKFTNTIYNKLLININGKFLEWKGSRRRL